MTRLSREQIFPAMKPDEKIAAIVQNNAFVKMLTELANGRTVSECAEELALVIEGVKRTGKKGVLTIELTVKPEGKGEVEAVEIVGLPKPKVPKRDPRSTTFFISGEHDLVRDDPKQATLKFPAPAAAKVAGAVQQ